MSASDYLSDSDKKFRQRMIIDNDIVDQLSKHSAHLFTYGMVIAEAEDNFDRCKARVERLEETLKISLRQKAILDRKKVTETMLLEKVHSHQDYIKCFDQMLDAKKLWNQTKAKYKALQDKGDSLRSLSLVKRREIEAEMNSAFRVKKGGNNGQ